MDKEKGPKKRALLAHGNAVSKLTAAAGLA